jgi:hypothetical protein
MSTPTIAVLIVAIIAIVAGGILWYGLRSQRSKKLRSQFGPEYDKAVEQYGSPANAERELAARQKRVESIPIHRLSDEERDRFAAQWHRVQAMFVDDPAESIHEADRLLCGVMRARGYPMSDFERRAEDLSVDHPDVVRNYRAAHEIAMRLDDTKQANTEDLRRALVYYRDLCDELLETQVSELRETRPREPVLPRPLGNARGADESCDRDRPLASKGAVPERGTTTRSVR